MYVNLNTSGNIHSTVKQASYCHADVVWTADCVYDGGLRPIRQGDHRVARSRIYVYDGDGPIRIVDSLQHGAGELRAGLNRGCRDLVTEYMQQVFSAMMFVTLLHYSPQRFCP